MIKNAVWECEWCGKTRELAWIESIFKWFLPRFCPVIGKLAGWESPTCRLTHALAARIAERTAKAAYDEAMNENKGKSLGDLRGHDLVQDISHNEKSIYKGKPYPTSSRW